MLLFNYFKVDKKYYLTIYQNDKIIKELKNISKSKFDQVFNKYYNNGYMIKLKSYI